MQDQEKVFADGFVFKRNPNAPDFVVGRLSMKVEEAIDFLKTHNKGGWVNVNIKTARSGSHYVELDTFDPTAKNANSPSPSPKGQTPAPRGTAPKPKPAPAPTAEEDELPF